MGLKILTLSLLVTILVFSTLIYGQSRPADRCIGNGTSVCLNCVTRGTCILNPDFSYSVIYSSLCPTTPLQTYCDDSLYDPLFYGQCAALPESATNCSCLSATQCIADPNDPSVVLHCESSPPVTDPSCPSGAVDLTTCSCSLSCPPPPACQLVDDPDDTCANFFICSGDDLIPSACTDGFCFDQMSCGCVERSTSTTPFTCPTDCQLVDNPNGDCASYFFCGSNPITPLSCPTSSCFDQASCGCKDITCPVNGCPFVDDPNDDCGKYFLCDGDYLIPQSCSGSLCFDQASCGCIDKGGSSTTTTTVATTTITTTTTTNASICTADCPYVDNPSPDQCGDFYVCDGNNLVPVVCPGVLCFDQVLCVCV